METTAIVSAILTLLAGIGAFFIVFSKKAGLKTWGGILAGFGMLFVGLSLMSGSNIWTRPMSLSNRLTTSPR